MTSLLTANFDSVFSPVLVDECECDVASCNICETQVCTNLLSTYILRHPYRFGEIEKHVCEDCLIHECCDCFQCENVVRQDDTREYNDSRLCDHCYNSDFGTCDDCGDITHSDSIFNVSAGNNICETCYDANYFRCNCCEEIYHINGYGSRGQCLDCVRILTEEAVIKPYATNVLNFLDFQGDSKDGIYFGVELETNCCYGELMNDAEATLRIVDGFAILKEDQSLTNGFEIVTAPATLDVQKKNWSNFLENKPSGMTSWESGDCGLHVHISRSALSPLEIGKMTVLLNDQTNARFIRAIAGRVSQRYAAFDSTKKITDGRKKPGSEYRYEALNLTNDSTVEIRIFRGTLNKLHFMANLEFCHALVYYCKQCSMRELGCQEFMSWVRLQPKSLYSNLIEFMTRKGF